MRDGVKLSVHVRRPEVPERVPAILQFTPYRKGPMVSGSAHPLNQLGYATLDVDIRGTGNSEGWNDSIYSDPERQDGHDLIEWAAGQPWCNGSIGVWGISFGAVVALQYAGMAPPHLKAVIARSGTDDPYTEWTNPGGSPRPYIYLNYSTIMAASNFAPPDPAEVGERWAAIWQERLERNVPWGIAFLEHLRDGPFWRDRSLRGRYDRVRCAAYLVDGWADWYHNPLLRTFANLKGSRKVLIGPWSHQWPEHGIPGPRIDFQPEAVRWFDQHLKGLDTGITAEPPVTLFIREHTPPATILLEEKGEFRDELEWPLARARTTPLYFGAAGVLSATASGEGPAGVADTLVYDPRVGVCTGLHGGGPFNTNWAMPLDQRPDEVGSLVYTTPPLEADLEVTGVPRVDLHASSTAPVCLFAAKLCDVAEDGTAVLVTKGFLNVAHRETHAAPSPVPVGEPCQHSFDLLTCAYRFRRGHRLRLMLAHADFLNVWPTPHPCTSSVFRSAARPSRIVLPVVPPRPTPLPAPGLRPSPIPPPTDRSQLEAPEFAISRDLIADTQTMTYKVLYGTHWLNRGSYTVSARDPARTVARGDSRRVLFCQGREIAMDVQCVTTSDLLAIHHTVDLEVTIDGRRHFAKGWRASAPRGHF
jgi:putative CocE/NonD family hydrolase